MSDAPFWAIMNGDNDSTGWLWIGYHRPSKDHHFDRDQRKAIRFCRKEDALRAGVGLTRGIRLVCINPVGEVPWPVLYQSELFDQKATGVP